MDRRVFLDTMVYLHYRPLDELDLPSVLQCETVTLVVPRITLRELDKHKSSHAKRKIRDRARRILSELESAIANGTPLKCGVSVEYFPEHPTDQLQEKNLNPEWADDVLVASVLAYIDTVPDRNVTVISQDTGPRLTCLHHGISTIQLEDDLALPEELDDIEKENRSLKQQLSRLTNALPKLTAVFDESETPLNFRHFTLTEPTKFDDGNLSDYLEALREKHPAMISPSDVKKYYPMAGPTIDAMNTLSKYDPNAITAQQIRRYNEELEAFYAASEVHYRKLYELDEQFSRTISFRISVLNTGTAPAEDVDVLLHFPDGFTLSSSEKTVELPVAPVPPDEPLGRVSQLMRVSPFSMEPFSLPDPLANFDQRSSLRIRKTNSYEVTDHFPRIKHRDLATLPEMHITFPSLSEAKSFECTYELRPANLTDPEVGKLRFIVDANKD